MPRRKTHGCPNHICDRQQMSMQIYMYAWLCRDGTHGLNLLTRPCKPFRQWRAKTASPQLRPPGASRVVAPWKPWRTQRHISTCCQAQRDTNENFEDR